MSRARRWGFVHPIGEPDAPALEALAEALLALSSSVALDAHGAWLEVGGSSRLLGGERSVAGRALALAERLGLEARIVVADRSETARVLARTGPTRLLVVPPGRDAAALAPLPLGPTGLAPSALGYLDRLGVRTLGALARLPPTALARRLGPEGMRLAHLARAEPSPPPRRYEPPLRPRASIELDPPLPPGEGVLFVVKRLLDELEVRLAGRGLAVAALRLSLAFEGGSSQCEELLLPRPLRSTRPLVAVLRERLSRSGEGDLTASEARIVTAEALVLRAVPALAAQPSLLEREEDAAGEGLPALLARLAAILGPDSVHAAALVPSHRPEASWRPAELAPSDPSRPRSKAMQTHEDVSTLEDPTVATEPVEPPSPRPLFLLPEPLAVSGSLETGGRLEWENDRGVVLRAWGPERLRGEWWASPFERDYYVVDLEDGERIWVYRDGVDGELHLHGIFD